MKPELTQEERDIATEELRTWQEETGRGSYVNTFDAGEISIYKSPCYGDRVRFADGSVWTLEQRTGMKWGLYDNGNGVLHSAIGLHAGVVDLCASINSQDRFLKDLMKRSTAAESVLRGETGNLDAIAKILS